MDGDARRVPFDESWLDTTARWLADEELAALIKSGPVDPEQQREWYASLATRDDYAIWGIELDGERVGVMGLKHLDGGDGRAEYFMYLGEKSVWGRGVARWATDEILGVARELGCAHVYGLVGKHNERSLAVHQHLGFQPVGEVDDKVVLSQPVPPA